MPLCTQQLEMEKREKKRKEKEKGVEGREECIEACRLFPNTTRHPFCTCLQVAAGSIGKGAHCACVREGLDHTCTHLLHFKVSRRDSERKTKSKSSPELQPANRLPAESASGRRHAVLLVLRCVTAQMLNYIPIYSPRVLRHPQ